jgi:uncharacterized protein (DUF58 family)
MSEAGQTLAAARLREGAEAAAAGLPPLLAAAERLAASVQFGLHGRRRAGQGDEFWQYRAAAPHDEARRIDWRRSGRSDQAFVREREWQAAQSVHLWVDRSAGMGFRSGDGLSAKGERAAVLGLAAAILLERAGERVGTADGRLPPRPGRAQLGRLADALGLGEDAGDELLGPDAGAILAGSRAIFLSDFLGGFAAVGQEVRAAAANGVRGVMVQVLDPAEEEFPFAGRTLFESMAGSLSHETREAGGLRRRYLERLAARRDALRALADETGWLAGLHRTDQPPAPALLWIHEGLRART